MEKRRPQSIKHFQRPIDWKPEPVKREKTSRFDYGLMVRFFLAHEHGMSVEAARLLATQGESGALITACQKSRLAPKAAATLLVSG